MFLVWPQLFSSAFLKTNYSEFLLRLQKKRTALLNGRYQPTSNQTRPGILIQRV